MVMSTLHTNSACETISRLLNMGVPAFNVATSVSLIIAQRLGRRLCQNCCKDAKLPREVLLAEGFREDELGTITIKSPVGCEKCNHSGYLGRSGIFEIFEITPEISQAILDNASSDMLENIARASGMVTLRESGLQKVVEGITSLEEVIRVTL